MSNFEPLAILQRKKNDNSVLRFWYFKFVIHNQAQDFDSIEIVGGTQQNQTSSQYAGIFRYPFRFDFVPYMRR